MYSNRLFSCGMWVISDLFDIDKVIPFSIWLKRGAIESDRLLWHGIVKQIDRSWLEVNRHNTSTIVCDVLINKKSLSIEEITQMHVKQLLSLDKRRSMRNQEQKYRIKNNLIHGAISENEWQSIFSLPRLLPIHNKVKDLQYKIIMRIVPTNYLLYKMRKINSPTCKFCYLEQESIEHLFFTCTHVKPLWFLMLNEIKLILGKELTPTIKMCIFGILDKPENLNETQCFMVNTALMIVKSYIMKCKIQNLQISTVSFVIYFRQTVEVLSVAFHKYQDVFSILRTMYQ